MVPSPNSGRSFRRALNLARQESNGASHFRRALWLLLATILACGLSTAAQVRSNVAGVNLSATLPDAISVTASPGQVNFALVSNGVSVGNPTLTINTAWALKRNTTVSTYGYFSASTAALSDGAGHNIPSSSVSGSVNGGGFQTFTGNCPFSANTCVTILTQRVTQPILGGLLGRGNPVGNDNSTLQLRISTVGLALKAGTYVGVLHIQVQAP
ncbi:MAG TPA: hypothetical protein VMF66_17040 [Candidatus Acidoferrum sp.]|nr:hypothetical protein [Candidatus Acidoferrum sp.]